MDNAVEIQPYLFQREAYKSSGVLASISIALLDTSGLSAILNSVDRVLFYPLDGTAEDRPAAQPSAISGERLIKAASSQMFAHEFVGDILRLTFDNSYRYDLYINQGKTDVLKDCIELVLIAQNRANAIIVQNMSSDVLSRPW